MIQIILDWCKGCGLCVTRCPRNAFEYSDKLNKRGVYPPQLKKENLCNCCKLCELICPDFAITVLCEEGKEEERPKDSTGKLKIGGIVNEV